MTNPMLAGHLLRVRVGLAGLLLLAACGGGGGLGSIFTGTLDDGFGTDGVIILPNMGGPEKDIATDVAIDGTGKIVVAGIVDQDDLAFSTIRHVFAVRLLSDGQSIDPTFNGGAPFEFAAADSGCNALALQGDKIVLVGSSQATPGASEFVLLIRLLSGGTLDGTFNGTGVKLYQPQTGRDAIGNDVIVDPNDPTKIIVAGSAEQSVDLNQQLLLARFLTTGAADTTFGEQAGLPDDDEGASNNALGYWLEGMGGEETALALKHDVLSNRLVLSGVTDAGGSEDVALARFLPTGIRDDSWGGFNSGTGNVRVLGGIGDNEQAIDVQVVGGQAIATGQKFDGTLFTIDHLSTKLLANGSALEPAFASGAPRIYDVDEPDAPRRSALARSDAVIVVAGGAGFGPASDSMVLQFSTTSGQVNALFGTGGAAIIDVGGVGADDIATALVEQGSDRLVVVGRTGTNAYVMRLTN